VTEIALSPAPRGVATAGDAGMLWLATQQVIAARIAHEYKNTLNGVAVNLEVVRSRLARAAAGASGSGPAYGSGQGQGSLSFAETASAEFERLSAQSEALLALIRPVRAPADVAHVAAQLAVLLGMAAGRDGGSLTVEGTDDGGARTSMDAVTVRLVVAQAMLAALEEGSAHEVRCTITAAPGQGPRLSMTRVGGGSFALAHDVARVASQAGIRLATGDDSGLLLTFPPAAGVDD
jgi:hypothetical protein